MTQDIRCFCIDCRATVDDSGLGYGRAHKHFLYRIEEGDIDNKEDIMNRVMNTDEFDDDDITNLLHDLKDVLDCVAKGHELVWEMY